jgi:FlgD Ig-like domain
VPSSVLVRVVFGVLVLATFGAFLVAQRLKRSTPIVDQVFYKRYLAPTCDDCKNKRVTFYFAPRNAGHVSATVVDDAGDDVKTLVSDRRLSRRRHRYVWDGRSDAGTLVPDGVYHLRVTLRDQGRSVTSPLRLIVDTKPPRPRVVVITPPQILPGAPGALGRARIRFRGRSFAKPVIQIYRTDVAKPEPVARFQILRGRHVAKWDGNTSAGTPAPDGIYVATVTIRDRAGNAGSAPVLLPPRRSEPASTRGVSVRYLTVKAPLQPVAAGSVAHFDIGPLARRMRWNLGPPGLGQPLARGQSKTRTLAVRISPDARTGLYYLRVVAAGHRAVQPVLVQGASRGSVLVVLPGIAWQGGNAVDDDGDGFANLLSAGNSVQTVRPFAHGLPPTGLRERVEPLLRFLTRERVPYTITSDIALAQGTGPKIAGHTGVVFAGDETWLTAQLDTALRAYVEGGGKIASFGTDSFRRRVTTSGSRLTDPTRPARINALGEQTAPLHQEQVPMAVAQDELGLFAGTDGFVGLFSEFEQSERLTAGARIASAAGRDRDHPAFVAYRLGKGIVVRAGAPAWTASLAGNPELTDVTRRIWSLLSR